MATKRPATGVAGASRGLQSAGKAAASSSSLPPARTSEDARPKTGSEVDRSNFWPDASSGFWPEGSGLRRTELGIQLVPTQVRQAPIDRAVRKVQNARNPGGGFILDQKPWEVSAGNTPVLDGVMHGTISHALSSSTVPLHMNYPRISDMKAGFIDHSDVADPPIKAFVNPRDHFVRYRDEFLKFGNQQIMRGNVRISKN
mmetsp:Transcript_60284/g.143655  ORF Transcript_60284/g.143655 Transcript_60284/m.143655 type:complete len:200 (+) Transcript_60284:120-719(+)|eukprot:CAMPEP_0178419544 /NCGR_PEP_ID=MMETSP0689_2-20121128/25666_1 /TAXON_ID=160604 /ORGANISM="Amphidinium massartii, Strain CS-259" /LENGTH=199 /DNA_ID=CAMNT_0020040987 /DNA_START=72 /DNA_END=671 /DNA_ORIENTATION=+